MRLQLLHAERNALLVGIDLQHLELEFLTGRENVGRLVDAAPGDIGDMKQAVDTADIDKRSVVGEAANRAIDDIALAKLSVTLLLNGTLFFFEHGAAINYEIFVGDVELGDAATNLLADQLLHLGSVANSAAGSRHKGAHADVDAEAALDLRGDGSDDAGFLGEGVL